MTREEARASALYLAKLGSTAIVENERGDETFPIHDSADETWNRFLDQFAYAPTEAETPYLEELVPELESYFARRDGETSARFLDYARERRDSADWRQRAAIDLQLAVETLSRMHHAWMRESMDGGATEENELISRNHEEKARTQLNAIWGNAELVDYHPRCLERLLLFRQRDGVPMDQIETDLDLQAERNMGFAYRAADTWIRINHYVLQAPPFPEGGDEGEWRAACREIFRRRDELSRVWFELGIRELEKGQAFLDQPTAWRSTVEAAWAMRPEESVPALQRIYESLNDRNDPRWLPWSQRAQTMQLMAARYRDCDRFEEALKCLDEAELHIREEYERDTSLRPYLEKKLEEMSTVAE
jgi:hypothetical protein